MATHEPLPPPHHYDYGEDDVVRALPANLFQNIGAESSLPWSGSQLLIAEGPVASLAAICSLGLDEEASPVQFKARIHVADRLDPVEVEAKLYQTSDNGIACLVDTALPLSAAREWMQQLAQRVSVPRVVVVTEADLHTFLAADDAAHMSPTTSDEGAALRTLGTQMVQDVAFLEQPNLLTGLPAAATMYALMHSWEHQVFVVYHAAVGYPQDTASGAMRLFSRAMTVASGATAQVSAQEAQTRLARHLARFRQRPSEAMLYL